MDFPDDEVLDDEVTPVFVDVFEDGLPTRPQKKWIVGQPNGRFDVVSGPVHEPPVCEGCARGADPDPSFEGSYRCGGCGTQWVPARCEMKGRQ